MTLRYGPDEAHVVDLYHPRTPGPLVIFIHGGFWRAAYDRTHARPLAEDLAAQGYSVALVEFRRTGLPGGGWPGTLHDVRDAIAAVPADLGSPVLAGHSAGGHLALWAAREVASRGVLALAGVCDLARAYALRLGHGATGDLLGGGPDDVPDRYAQADPMRRLPLRVPTRLVHGVEDEIVPLELSRDYAAAARAAGDRVDVSALPGIEHYGVIDPRSPAWPAVLTALRELAPLG